MKYLLLLLLTMSLFSCKKKGDTTEVQRDLSSSNPFMPAEITFLKNLTPSEDRKLRYVLKDDDKTWGFFSDQTAHYIEVYDELTQVQVQNLIEQEPKNGYAMTDDGKIWLNGETAFDTSNNSDYQWLMKDYEWISPPELDFVNYPAHNDSIPNIGVRLLLDGYCEDNVYDTPESSWDEHFAKQYRSFKKMIDADDWYKLSYDRNTKSFSTEKMTIDTTHFYWDCGGYDMVSVSSTNHKQGDLVFLAGIDNLGNREIKSHFHRQTSINPDKMYNFVFEGVDYKLRAEGIAQDNWNHENELNEDGRLNTGNVYRNYKLYLSSGDTEQLLLAIESFSDRYVAIEFVGDLDGDGKPDFLFETSTWYEDFQKTLFLSSKADEGKLVKLVARSGYSMAC